MANRLPDDAVPAPDADLCLAYANTRYWRGTATPTEQLNSPEDLLQWAAATQRLPPPLIDRLSACWRERPDEAAIIFHDAINLREAIFRSLCRHGQGSRTARRGRGHAECGPRRGTATPAPAPRRLGYRHARSIGQRVAGADAMVRRGPSGRVATSARTPMCQSGMRLAVPRQQQKRQPSLVLHERLREPRQGASALSAAEREVRARAETTAAR